MSAKSELLVSKPITVIPMIFYPDFHPTFTSCPDALLIFVPIGCIFTAGFIAKHNRKGHSDADKSWSR